MFIEPVPVAGVSARGNFFVSGFGAGVKTVVIAIGLAEDVATHKGHIKYITCRYRYGVHDPVSDMPTAFALTVAYPNPFNPAIHIAYDVSRPGVTVRIDVHDVSDRRVRTLVSRWEPPGRQSVRRGGGEEGLPSGVYFLRMKAGYYVDTRKIVFIK